jgi:PAS domain S-box-containing protein
MPLAALIQHEQWFRALIEQSSDAITLVTAEGTILYASPAIARVTGYTAEELVGTNGFAFVHPDELERKPQRFNDLLDHPGKVITVEYRLRLKDGSWRWMEGTATNLLHDPVIGTLVVNCRDITERKQAEEERSQLLAREQAARIEAETERRCVEDLNRQLEAEKDALRQTQQEAEARVSELAAIFEAMTDGVVVSNSEGQARHTNAAFRAFFNLQADTDPESLLAHKRNAGALPRDLAGRPLPKDQWAISRVLHGERLSGTNTMDLMCHTSEEQDMYFNASGAPILDDAGQIVGGVVVFRDVTEKRRLEQQLQYSERKLRSLVESNILGMAVVDLDGRIYDINDWCVQLLGYRRDELLSESFNWSQLVPPENHEALELALTTILSTGNLPPTEGEYLRKDGSHVPVLTAATLLDRERRLMLGVILDMSEQKAAERRKQDFLSMVSHELRTPLQSIMGFVELALLYREILPSPLSPEAEELIGKIEMVLKRAMGQVNTEARLVEELLDVSRLETQTLDLALQRCNLTAIVQEAVAEQQQAAVTRHLELVLPSQEKVPVMVDPGRIGQALTNYLTNALRYSPAEQGVLVRLDVEEPMARVSVVDQGPGLTPEQQQQIWEWFYQAVPTGYRGVEGGLGLGLHIARSIIEQHGGRVGVESRLGHGSTFWFTLPLADDSIQA